jgi:glyoxylase-like metal-dependent hydrolase (beta-lactamase superfamily II)/ferredoxin
LYTASRLGFASLLGSDSRGLYSDVAQWSDRLEHNASGDFFVDSSCIDCDTCRWMAPATFVDREGQASVARQPRTEGEIRRALMALLSCPTASIGTADEHDTREALAALPDPIAGGVYHCGFHSEASFGAASYLIVREPARGGNVLVDSPRFTRPLVRRLEELGGVKTMFLTHRDDVADHRQFHDHFGCERILHARDVSTGTRDVERLVDGDDPFVLDDEIRILPTPGHTRGSACLLYREEFLFTGDHLAWSETRGHIYAFRSACWFDWRTLVRSAERVAEFSFEWILPGHGRRCHFPRERMKQEMERALVWMRRAA